MKIRRILRQTPKKTLVRLGESLAEQHIAPVKSINTIETLPSSAGSENEHRICLFSDSPHYIVRVSRIHRLHFVRVFSTICFRWLEREMFKNSKRFFVMMSLNWPYLILLDSVLLIMLLHETKRPFWLWSFGTMVVRPWWLKNSSLSL